MDDQMEQLKQKLLSRIEILDTGCWLWIGATGANGYGNIRWDGKYYHVHRMSWLVHNGDIPDGMCVLHKCDVRGCINPKHLFLGTYQDNHDDMHAKGRANHRSTAILDEEQVKEIKSLLSAGYYSQREIGEMFGVSRSTILNIRLGHNWSHV